MSDPFKLTELDLLPQWAREPMPQGGAGSFDGDDEPAEHRRRPDRFEREERDGHRDRDRGRDRRGPPRGERRDRDRGQGNPGGARSERPGGPKLRSGGGPREGGPRRFEESRPEPAAPPPDIGLEVSFLPDPHGAESMARQIRSTCLAYPVFELAKVALKKDIRHHVILRKKSDATLDLFRCTLDGTVWLDRSAGAAHVVEKHLGVFYEEEQVPCDPPKGNFTALGVCSLDRTVLGPVNHHDYQNNVRRLHQKKFARMPFEDFKAKIQIIRDAEQIEAWRQSQAFKTVYVARATPVFPKRVHEGESVAVVPEAAPARAPSGGPVGETMDEPPAEVPVSAETPGDAPARPLAETAVAIQAEAGAEPLVEETAAEVPAASSEVPPPVAETERLGTLAEVRDHFLRTHAETFLVPVDEVVLETVEARHSGSAEIREQIRFALDQELRFPLKTAKVLIRQLGKFGLQFFKWGKGATFVSGIRPKRFESDPAALSDGVRAVYEWVLARPGGRRDQLFKAMARNRSAGEVIPAAAAPVGSEGETSAVVAETQPEPAPPGATDLLWLVREGLVIAFADGRLDLIRGVPKKTEPAPAREEGKVAVVEVRTPVPETTPEAEAPVADSGPAQVDPLPADPSDDPEAEREGAGDEPV